MKKKHKQKQKRKNTRKVNALRAASLKGWRTRRKAAKARKDGPTLVSSGGAEARMETPQAQAILNYAKEAAVE